MQSIFPTTERDATSDVSKPVEDKPFDLSGDEPLPAAPPAKEFVMGPRQMATLAFLGVLAIGIMSAVAYFAGRRNTAPTAEPKVTERVIERVVHEKAVAPAPVPAPATPAPAPQPTQTTAAAVAKTPEPAPAPKVPAKAPPEKPEVAAPILNRVYMQLGSVEPGIAQVMVEGLRTRGIPAMVGIGVNQRVARVLVGPFTSPEQQRAAQKQIEDLGFKPFQRTFSEADLKPQPDPIPTAPKL